MRGHWGVEVRIKAVGDHKSSFVYVTRGWNEEEVGDEGEAANYRLAKFPKFRAWDGKLGSPVLHFLTKHKHIFSPLILEGVEHLLSASLIHSLCS